MTTELLPPDASEEEPAFPYGHDLALMFVAVMIGPPAVALVLVLTVARRSALLLGLLLDLAALLGAPLTLPDTPVLQAALPGVARLPPRHRPPGRVADPVPARFAPAQQPSGTPALPTVALDTLAREDNILVVGNKDAGKTTLLVNLIQRRRSVHFVFDPHAAPGKWPDDAQVIGGGLDFEAIMQRLVQAHARMRRRYQELAGGTVVEGRHPHCTLVADEWRAIVQDQPEAGKAMLALLTQGRKVRMAFIAGAHGDTVESLGVRGDKDAAVTSFDWIIYLGGFVRQRVDEATWQRIPTTTTRNGKLLPLVVVAHNTTERRDYLLDLRGLVRPVQAPAPGERDDQPYLDTLLADQAYQPHTGPRAAPSTGRAGQQRAIHTGATVRLSADAPAETEFDPTTPATPEELRKTVQAVQRKLAGEGKEKAICAVWGCSKGGGNKTWRRASWLFDQAMATSGEGEG